MQYPGKALFQCHFYLLVFLAFLLPVTLLAQPSQGATSFLIDNVDGDRFRIRWNSGDGDRRLVVASEDPNFNGAGVPADGTDYLANNAFGVADQIGPGNYVIYKGTGTSVTMNGLDSSSTYFIRIYEFNGADFNTLYNTTDVLEGSGTTLFPPGIGPSNISISGIKGNAAGIKWDRGDGNRNLAILRQGSIPGDPTLFQSYFSSATFGSGSSVGGGRALIAGTQDTVYVRNLDPNTWYYLKILEYNGTSNPVYNYQEVAIDSFLTATKPTEGSTSPFIDIIEGDRLRVRVTSGDGSRRLFVARQDDPVSWTPVDGQDYTANGTFGQGDEVSPGTFIVGKGSGSSQTVTGLTPATDYHFAVYEFNGEGSNTFYLTEAEHVAVVSGSTLSPPSVQAGEPEFSNITGNSVSVTFPSGDGNGRIVLVSEGAPVADAPVNLITYFSSSSYSSAPTLGGSKIVYRGTGNSVNISNLQPAINYHFAIFEYNGSSGPVYNQVDPGRGDFSTQGAPTIPTTNLTFSNIDGDRFRLNYQPGDGVGRIVIGRLGAPVSAFPEDGNAYTASTSFGNGHDLGDGNFVLQNTSNNNTTVSGLQPMETYHFAIIEYNGSGAQRLYMGEADALTGSQSTLFPPTQQATDLSFTDITSNSVHINWENGDGDGRIVLMRPDAPVEDMPQNLSSYFATSNYGSASSLGSAKVVYAGNGNNREITNVPPGSYYVAVIEYNGSSGRVYRTVDPLTGMVEVGGPPLEPAVITSFSSIEGDRIRINFTRGDGTRRLGIVKEGSPVDTWPVDGTGYSSSTNFGNGSELGAGNFVVYDGTGSSFTTQNLEPEKEYHFAVVEYNGSGTNSFYQDPAIVATASQSTLGPPSVPTSNIFANNVIGNQMNITWTNGDGDGRLVIARMGAPVNQAPEDLSNYFSHNSFGTGTNLGDGNYVVYAGTGDNFLLRSLEPDTTYHLTFYEYNGNSGRVYLRDPVTAVAFNTAPRPSQPAASLSTSNIQGNRININFSAGNGTRRIVVLRKGGPVLALPEDLTTYSGGNFGTGSPLGNPSFVVLNLTGSNGAIQGLEPDTEYGIAIFEFDGSPGRERYFIDQFLTGFIKTAAPPGLPPNNLLFNSVGSTSANISWTNGTGQNRMVVLRPFQPVTFGPEDLNTHGASSTNYSQPSTNLGGSHKHMYRGSNSSINITNLDPGTTYHVSIFEYNGTTGPVYNQVGLTGFFTTPPDAGLAVGGFDAITFCPSQSFDIPYLYSGVLNPGNVLEAQMSDIDGSFDAPTFLGSQSTTNNQGFIPVNLPSSLTEGLGYRFRIIATNPNEISPDNGADLQILTAQEPDIDNLSGVTETCGEPIQLSTSQPGYNVQWFRDGVPIPNAIIESFQASTSGSYQVRISGAYGGCQLFSDPIELAITPRPDFDIRLDDEYCETEGLIVLENVLPEGGSFTGPGMDGETFDPLGAGVGQHFIEYEYIDSQSGCVYAESKFVIVNEGPELPIAVSDEVCGSGTVVLSASGAGDNDIYRWYDVSTGGSHIQQSINPDFETPVISETTEFYVSLLSPNGCESERVPVDAMVIPPPAEPGIDNGDRCGPGSVLLSASGATGVEIYRWFENSTDTEPVFTSQEGSFDTPELNETQTFYVEIFAGDDCISDRVPVMAIITDQVAVEVTLDGNQFIAPDGAATYQWYRNGSIINGATSHYLDVFDYGVYYVSVTGLGGCDGVSEPIEFFVTDLSDPGYAGWEVFPNPTSGILNIKIPATKSKAILTIYDLQGRMVTETTVHYTSEYHQWEIKDLPQGIYYLHAKNGDEVKTWRILFLP